MVITKGRVAPFIATLGMMTAARGLAYIISGGRPVSRMRTDFAAISGGDVLGVPIPVPSSGSEMYLVDLRDKGRRFKWSAGAIESCAWSPDSKELYVTSDARGEGVYRLRLSDLGD